MSSAMADTTLLVGTDQGVYRTPIDDVADSRRVLASDTVLRVRRFDDVVFATTRSGLFRSRDNGETWTDLNVPRCEVYSVALSPDGECLYAGTHPAHLYVSADGGCSWRELSGFQDVPSRGMWHTPRHRNEAHVRSISVHPEVPDRVVAGVEVGGVLVSDDRGKSFEERRATLQTERTDDLQYDVHHVLALSGDEFLISCGGGLFRIRNAGGSWTRLDDHNHPYFRESFSHGGRLYAAATRGPWNSTMDAMLFEATDDGDPLEAVSYPGAGDEFVLSWAASDSADGDVFAGTHTGSVLRRVNDEWKSVGNVPGRCQSLALV
ncbi:WD40/YVTN/BNR-like repeat-containing protein [Halocatena halophila]|uniref:WD40/YVTN/BNR-like repeat-containing protein n=1 Tax=Halocatena halophila TaxID=2814576 RepID=UPI002ED3ED31